MAGGSGTGRDTAGGERIGAAAGIGTAGAKAGEHARLNPAAELGFSGDPGQHGALGDDMLHAQRTWDGTLATNRLDELGVNIERLRVEIKDVTASVALVLDGRPEDVARCVQSVIDHSDARVLAIDLGNIDGAGDVVHELAERHPERIVVWHVAEEPRWRGGTASRGACRDKLMKLDEADVHVLMETNVVLRGDALTPLIAAVVEGAVAAGWHGLESSDGDYQVAAGPGKVRALTGELMVVRRAAALRAISELPDDVDDGRDADLRFSQALPGELIVPAEPLQVAKLGPHD
ncbi:hypothetical protein ABZ897_31485 [Nonomuraea sp. NPDC046802]|uniref:hypothetical protein n=1 Tax=Nonomuraea sp. NPDC046802 TaxID=3154919 RepID=UPI0033CEE440